MKNKSSLMLTALLVVATTSLTLAPLAQAKAIKETPKTVNVASTSVKEAAPKGETKKVAVKKNTKTSKKTAKKVK